MCYLIHSVILSFVLSPLSSREIAINIKQSEVDENIVTVSILNNTKKAITWDQNGFAFVDWKITATDIHSITTSDVLLDKLLSKSPVEVGPGKSYTYSFDISKGFPSCDFVLKYSSKNMRAYTVSYIEKYKKISTNMRKGVKLTLLYDTSVEKLRSYELSTGLSGRNYYYTDSKPVMSNSITLK